MTTTAPKSASRWSSLGSLSSLLAVVTCYGTLAGVALLSLVGVSVDISETFLVKVIYRLHRHLGPVVLSLAAAGLLLWVFFGSYSKPLEVTGFAGLVLASVWDFRVKKQACAAGARE